MPKDHNNNQSFYEDAGMVFMQPNLFTPPIHDYLQAEGVFFANYLSGAARVLEVGCGAGNNLIRFAPSIGEMIGLDYAIQMVTQARARTRNYNNVSVVRGNAETLSQHVIGEFNRIIFAWNTFGNMTYPQHQQILAELRKILRGSAYLSVYRTGNDVIQARLDYYAHIQIEVKHIDDNHITLYSGGEEMTAYAYPKHYYRQLMAETGFGVNFHDVSEIGMIVEITPLST